MARKNRIHVPDSIYHVMLRGNFSQAIFYGDEHRIKFLSFIEDRIEKFHFKVHLFCLMTNHIHLVIQIDDIPLYKIMQSLISGFSRYLNNQLNQKGHLFVSFRQAYLT